MIFQMGKNKYIPPAQGNKKNSNLVKKTPPQ
ncbi:MAG: hypothetical protein K0Q79_516 [Flavipsychrobacter sp.]|nr:hypothetical protein [Flavipsychrobacter sp.]